jgi:hypothetical protein
MARNSRLEMDWWHTANILAQQANLNRGKNSPSITADKLNPFATKKAARQATPEEIKKLLGDQWTEVNTS